MLIKECQLVLHGGALSGPCRGGLQLKVGTVTSPRQGGDLPPLLHAELAGSVAAAQSGKALVRDAGRPGHKLREGGRSRQSPDRARRGSIRTSSPAAAAVSAHC